MKFSLAVLTALLLPVAAAQTVTLKHDEGVTTVKKDPQRIVVMEEESLGWLAALGVSDRIVGLGSTYFSPSDLSGGKIKPDVLKSGFYGRLKLNHPA